MNENEVYISLYWVINPPRTFHQSRPCLILSVTLRRHCGLNRQGFVHTAVIPGRGAGLRASTNVTGPSAADLELLILFSSLSAGIEFSRGHTPSHQDPFFSDRVLNRRGRRGTVVSKVEGTWEEMCRQGPVGRGRVGEQGH